MCSQAFALFRGQLAGLTEEFFVYSDFADVVQQACEVNFLYLFLVELFGLGELLGNPL